MPPKVEGEFQITRSALTAGTERFDQFFVGGMDGGGVSQAVEGDHLFGKLQPCSVESALSIASTGESFSRVSGSLGPTSRHSAMMMLVFRGL